MYKKYYNRKIIHCVISNTKKSIMLISRNILALLANENFELLNNKRLSEQLSLMRTAYEKLWVDSEIKQ